MVMAG
jgi:hypothetical protein